MQCYRGFRDDRICDICKRLDEGMYNRCKVARKIHVFSPYLLKCKHCKEIVEEKYGTDGSYGYDSSYHSYKYVCTKTGKECKRPEDECLDFFVKKLL